VQKKGIPAEFAWVLTRRPQVSADPFQRLSVGRAEAARSGELAQSGASDHQSRAFPRWASHDERDTFRV